MDFIRFTATLRSIHTRGTSATSKPRDGTVLSCEGGARRLGARVLAQKAADWRRGGEVVVGDVRLVVTQLLGQYKLFHLDVVYIIFIILYQSPLYIPKHIPV